MERESSCYFYGTISDCKGITVAPIVSFIIELLLCATILFIASDLVRLFIKKRDGIYKPLIEFYLILMIESAFNTFTFLFYFNDKDEQTMDIFQSYTDLLQSIAYIILAEQSTVVLCALNFTFSNFFKYFAKFLKNAIFIISTAFLIIVTTYIPSNHVDRYKQYEYITVINEAFTLYIIPFSSMLAILILSFTYIFVPSSSSLYPKRTLILIKIMIFTISFLSVIRLGFAIFDKYFNKDILIAFRGIKAVLVVLLFINFSSYIIPAFIQTISMYTISQEKSKDNEVSTDKVDMIINEALLGDNQIR